MGFLVYNKKSRLQEFFFVNPTKVTHLRELSRITKISFPWVRRLVSELVGEGLIIKTRERGLVLVKANRENNTFLTLKRSYNLFALQQSGLVECLNEAYRRPEAIVLFGSYSRGEDVENSDIDIAVITRRNLNIDIAPIERKLQRRIKLIELEHDKISDEFLNTLANGIVLTGYLEVR